MIEPDWLLLRSAPELAGELTIVPRPQPLYLLASAFLRRAWDWLPSESWRFAVEATERFARGQTTARDFTESWVNAEADTADVPFSEYRWGCPCCEGDSFVIGDEIHEHVRPAIGRLLRRPPTFAAECAFAALRTLVDASVCRANDPRWVEERRAQFDLFRDIAMAPAGLADLTPMVRSSPELAGLVRAIDRQDEIGAVDLLALADALEEAGCTERTLLDHCRRGGRHQRGCWALEYLTGRATRPLPAR